MPAGGQSIDWSAIPDEASSGMADTVDRVLSQKIGGKAKDFVLAQLRHETGNADLMSNVSKKNNNYSGITYDERYFPKEWKGTARPASEGGNYVKFPTVEDWAESHVNTYLKKDKGAGAPLDADTVEDYVHRLKKNGYFTAPETDYLAGMRHYLGNSAPSIDWSAIPDEAVEP